MANPANDLTGKRYGKLVVTGLSGRRSGQLLWRCKCDCGRYKDIVAYSLTHGRSRSCGRCTNTIGERAFVDRTGQRYGRLVAIRRIGTKHHEALWLCRCDCGSYVEVVGGNLENGNTESCGCLRKETASIIGLRTTTHGKSKTRLYEVWSTMKQRCANRKQISYSHYGARGIKVCDEWLNDFASFYEWSMKAGYDPEAPRGACTLDRIDNDGDYEPSNCRWVDMSVQRSNQSRK